MDILTDNAHKKDTKLEHAIDLESKSR